MHLFFGLLNLWDLGTEGVIQQGSRACFLFCHFHQLSDGFCWQSLFPLLCGYAEEVILPPRWCWIIWILLQQTVAHCLNSVSYLLHCSTQSFLIIALVWVTIHLPEMGEATFRNTDSTIEREHRGKRLDSGQNVMISDNLFPLSVHNFYMTHSALYMPLGIHSSP